MMFLAALVLVVAKPAWAQSRAKVGMLSCKTGPSIGLIVGSRQRKAVFAIGGK